jgi:hypothetical protein
MRWVILLAATLAAGCGQVAATAPVAHKARGSAAAPQANFVAGMPSAPLPAGPSPRGWLVEFAGGPLDGQSGTVPRDYKANPPWVGGITGDFGGRFPVTVSIGPTESVLTVTWVGEGDTGHGVITGTGTSFSGSGTFFGIHAPQPFSATVTEIP